MTNERRQAARWSRRVTDVVWSASRERGRRVSLYEARRIALDELHAEALAEDAARERPDVPCARPAPIHFEPVRDDDGMALYVHVPCKGTEWWNESVEGPINDQGCDACESAPDGQWRAVYVLS